MLINFVDDTKLDERQYSEESSYRGCRMLRGQQ